MEDLCLAVETVSLEMVETMGGLTVSSVETIEVVRCNGTGDVMPGDSEVNADASELNADGSEANPEGSDSGVELASHGPLGSRGSSLASEELMTQSLTLTTSRGRVARQPSQQRSVSNLDRPPRSTPPKHAPPPRDDGRWPSSVAKPTRASSGRGFKPAPNPKPASLTTPPRRATPPTCSERINRLAASKWASTERPPSTSSSGSERADWLTPRSSQRPPANGRPASAGSANRRPGSAGSTNGRPGSGGPAFGRQGSGGSTNGERFWSLPRRPTQRGNRSASAGRDPALPRIRRREVGVQTGGCHGCRHAEQRRLDALATLQAANTALTQEMEALSTRARQAESEAQETQEFQQAEMVTLSEALAHAEVQRERCAAELRDCQHLVALSEQRSQQSSLSAGAAVSVAAVALSAMVARLDSALGQSQPLNPPQPSVPIGSDDFAAQVAALDLRLTRLLQLANLPSQ